jgi:hypothetical protein
MIKLLAFQFHNMIQVETEFIYQIIVLSSTIFAVSLSY